MRWTLSIALLCLASSAGCNWSSAARTGPAALPIDGRTPAPERGPTRKLPREISYALETRIADLEERGGTCSAYGQVLERSYREGRILLRPFMWRVGNRLASGQGLPSGDMVLARDIDSLNVGLRSVDDVLWSMEHEAVHIALRLHPRSGFDPADRYVRACRLPANAG